MSDSSGAFPGTEHYRQKARRLEGLKVGIDSVEHRASHITIIDHNQSVHPTRYISDITALCDHIEEKDERVEDLSNRLSDVIEKNTILTLEMAGKRAEVERLQERVGGLEGALQKAEEYLSANIALMYQRHDYLIPSDGLSEEKLRDELRVALSQANAQAKLENQEEDKS